MQSLAEKVVSGAGPRPEKAASKTGWSTRRQRWAIGAGCVVAVLLLFGLFHSRPVPQPRMAQLEAPASGGNHLAIQDANSAALTMTPPKAATAKDNYQRALAAAPPRSGIVSDALTAPGSASSPAPMIAHTVSLSSQVKDVGASRTALDAILARYQGYAAELSMNTPENAARSFAASLRIPAPALPAALNELRRLGRVQSESQTGEEVTQQHTDLVARLKNARETEQRLLAILAQRTGRVSDVLEVEEQISNTRGEIERMEAEQKALEHRVDFATVQLQLAEEFKAQLNAPSTTVGTRIHNAFVNGLGNAGDSIVGILLFLEEYGPALLVWFAVLGVPAWLVWRRYRNAQSRI